MLANSMTMTQMLHVRLSPPAATTKAKGAAAAAAESEDDTAVAFSEEDIPTFLDAERVLFGGGSSRSNSPGLLDFDPSLLVAPPSTPLPAPPPSLGYDDVAAAAAEAAAALDDAHVASAAAARETARQRRRAETEEHFCRLREQSGRSTTRDARPPRRPAALARSRVAPCPCGSPRRARVARGRRVGGGIEATAARRAAPHALFVASASRRRAALRRGERPAPRDSGARRRLRGAARGGGAGRAHQEAGRAARRYAGGVESAPTTVAFRSSRSARANRAPPAQEAGRGGTSGGGSRLGGGPVADRAEPPFFGTPAGQGAGEEPRRALPRNQGSPEQR